MQEHNLKNHMKNSSILSVHQPAVKYQLHNNKKIKSINISIVNYSNFKILVWVEKKFYYQRHKKGYHWKLIHFFNFWNITDLPERCIWKRMKDSLHKRLLILPWGKILDWIHHMLASEKQTRFNSKEDLSI